MIRSASMKGPMSHHLNTSIDKTICATASGKCFSISLDNLQLGISRDQLESTCMDISRSKGIPCLIVPDEILLTEVVQRQRSVSLRLDGCTHCRRGNENGSQSKLHRSLSSKEANHSTGRMNRSHTVHSFNGTDEMSLSTVPSRLYDQKRSPHSCAHIVQSPRSTIKPSPWTYGSSTPKNSNKHAGNDANNSKRLTGSDPKLRRPRSSTISNLSLDSTGSLTKQSFSPASSSSDLEKDVIKDLSPIKRPSTAILSSQKTHEQLKNKKQSFIPRPVTPNQNQVTRSRSFTIGEFSFGGNRNSPQKSSSARNRPSPKKSEHSRLFGDVRSAPTSALCTPTTPKPINGWMDNIDNQKQDISRSSDSFQSKYLFIVPDDEDSYPEPKPPSKYKIDIYHSKDYIQIDQHSKQAPESTLDSFNNLLEYLLKDQTSDVAKARALFSWIVSANIPLSSNLGQRNIDTPRGFLYNIGQRLATFPELYATVCRKAGIPCVIIHGLAKGAAHEVGSKITPKKHKNSWNAVYVEDDWHFVHPLWARHTVNGYSTGRWSVVENNAYHTGDLEWNDASTRKSSDFYFLTDPDKFINKCFAEDSNWQLLHHSISLNEFENIPFLQPAFHDLKLTLLDSPSCVLHTENGKVTVKISFPAERSKRYSFGYKLFARRESESEGEYDVIDLRRHILHYVYENTAVFEVRFPVIGVFKLELHCEDSKRPLASTWICDFKITCQEFMPECEPLPIVPKIGWGFGSAMEETELEPLTHKHPVVSLDEDTTTYIRFALPRDRSVELETELSTNNQLLDELKDHVVICFNEDHVTLQVSPPHEGEYALQIFVMHEDGTRKNICNYLMNRTMVVEDPELADVRAELVRATENGDVDNLAHWLDKFNELSMDDRGDLFKAKRKLQLAKLHRDIQDAMDRQDLDLLEKALHSASDTTIRRHLGNLHVQAEAMRSRLRRLKRLRHEVLGMDQKTISEIRSYPKPPVAVHAVMAATFLLLGNREAEMKKWSKIQALISKHGRESLKRRVADFKPGVVPPAILKRVHEILSRYDLETVQITSAGAATFYQWASTMAGEADDETTV
ncbi:hypothetical protein ACF0H5_012936 [Mactra antiquata]